MNRRPQADKGDEGSVLVLSLLVLFVLIMLVTVSLNYASVNLRATTSFRTDRALQASAQGALDQVVDTMRTRPDQGIRYQGTGGGTPPCPNTASGSSWPTSGPVTNPLAISSNGTVLSVTCTGVVPSGSLLALQRDVEFVVSCVSRAAPAACPTNTVLLEASVSFYDRVNFPGNSVAVTNWSQGY